jgi:dihydrofolate reductase
MNLIVVVDNKWGIGKNNGLLFDLKLDMKHFVEHTKGKVVVMGANTLRSLPNGMPLKNRTNIVLNPSGDIFDAINKGYILTTSLDELLEQVYAQKDNEVYVIGGQ